MVVQLISLYSSLRVRQFMFNFILGCMDETACNYNTEANMEDGSCTYSEQGYDCDGDEIITYSIWLKVELCFM